MRKILRIFVLALLPANITYAAGNETIEGHVTNGGKPVKDLTIIVSGSAKKAAQTNRKGYFKIKNTSSADTLMLTLNQEKTYRIPLEGFPIIEIQLREDTVFVTRQKRVEPPPPTYGGTIVTKEMLEKTGETNLLRAIARRVAGVEYVNNDLRIRGPKSLMSTDPGMSPFEKDAISRREAPLYIVNGMETKNASYYTVMEVEYVEVVKDASASMFGIKGGNGVVIITLKK